MDEYIDEKYYNTKYWAKHSACIKENSAMSAAYQLDDG